MNVVNKLAVTVCPLPFTLLVTQMTIAVVLVLSIFGWRDLLSELYHKKKIVWQWALLTLPFAGMLITSMLAVQAGSVTFLLVSRNLLPLVSLFAERFFLPSSAR